MEINYLVLRVLVGVVKVPDEASYDVFGLIDKEINGETWCGDLLPGLLHLFVLVAFLCVEINENVEF